MSRAKDGPVYPSERHWGISLRAHIATEIAKAIASNPNRDASPGIIAEESVKVADAIIRELEKEEA